MRGPPRPLRSRTTRRYSPSAGAVNERSRSRPSARCRPTRRGPCRPGRVTLQDGVERPARARADSTRNAVCPPLRSERRNASRSPGGSIRPLSATGTTIACGCDWSLGSASTPRRTGPDGPWRFPGRPGWNTGSGSMGLAVGTASMRADRRCSSRSPRRPGSRDDGEREGVVEEAAGRERESIDESVAAGEPDACCRASTGRRRGGRCNVPSAGPRRRSSGRGRHRRRSGPARNRPGRRPGARRPSASRGGCWPRGRRRGSGRVRRLTAKPSTSPALAQPAVDRRRGGRESSADAVGRRSARPR